MKKLFVILFALSALVATATYAGEDCKKCSGADTNAPCTCKCDGKEKGSCSKDDKAAAPKDDKAPQSGEKKN